MTRPLSPAMRAVLEYLDAVDTATVFSIAHECGTRARMTMRALVRRGLIVRHTVAPDNGRAPVWCIGLYRLTDAGRAEVDRG